MKPSPSHLERTRLLVQAIQDLSLARDIDTVQAIVRTAARGIAESDGATFVLRDGDCCSYVDEDAITPLWKGLRFPLTNCISGWSMLHQAPAVIPDIYADARIPHDAYRPTFVKSLVMVPIRTKNPIGAIGNYWAHPHTASTDEVEFLQALADSTSIAMENIHVYQHLEETVCHRTEALQDAYEKIKALSYTDELTGLLNRRGFWLMGEQAMKQACRAHLPCAVTFLDLDGLKRVNDSLGHEAGDAMIAHIARILKVTCRDADVVGRLGGDEFCVLTVGEGAWTHLEDRLRRAIAASTDSGAPYTLSASMGSSMRGVDEPGVLEDLVAEADRLMYEDKRARKAQREVAEQS